jgi:putative hydroxymethylpyrimidine transport system permease protein
VSLAPVLVVVLGLAAWEAYVRLDGIDELLLAAPTQIAESLYDDRSLLAGDLLVTFEEVAAGLAGSVVLGAGLALAMHRFDRVRAALYPLVVGSQAVPIPAIAPLLVFLLGFGLGPKIVVIVLICFFPITINLYDGLRRVDPDQRKLLRTLHASRGQTLRLLELPAAMPQFFTGLKVAAAVSVIGAVFAEFSGSDAGLGRTLRTATSQLETPRAFAAVVLLFALAIALYGAFALAERKLVDWHPARPPRHEPGGP